MLYRDNLGVTIELKDSPKRIVSLVPSQTELLYDLGIGDKVVGVTRFCVHPKAWCKDKTKIGGTKDFDFKQIEALKPDLIIGNKEENYKEGIDKLKSQYPVWMSDINSLTEATKMILDVSEIVGKADQGKQMVQSINRSFEGLSRVQPKRKCAYLIWRKPYMAAGSPTFINDMLERAGFENMFTSPKSRYPEVTIEMLKESGIAVLLLSSEPYPFNDRHISELKKVLPNIIIQLVDGELFSWYGSRLLQTADYLSSLAMKIK